REVEGRDRRRKQRQVEAVAASRGRQPLHERGYDPPPFDRRRDAPGHVQERVEVGVGEELAEHLEAALPAPHSGEPVMDQGHPHSLSIAAPYLPAPRPAWESTAPFVALSNTKRSRLR